MPIRVIFRSVFTVPPPSRCIRTILCRDSLPPGILVHSAFELECEGVIHFAELPRVPASHHGMPRGVRRAHAIVVRHDLLAIGPAPRAFRGKAQSESPTRAKCIHRVGEQHQQPNEPWTESPTGSWSCRTVLHGTVRRSLACPRSPLPSRGPSGTVPASLACGTGDPRSMPGSPNEVSNRNWQGPLRGLNKLTVTGVHRRCECKLPQ